MKKRLTMLMASLLLTVAGALAQTVVKGTVLSHEDGQPIVGAVVKIAGMKVGMLTDANGSFELNMPANKKNIQISYVGYTTQTLAAKNGMTVYLREDAAAIDEVVVVAYGKAKKSAFTGSAESVDAKQMELRPITAATKGLEGHVSGVMMTAGSGQPGSSPNIRIRGFGSINAASSPLYVVDGIPYDGELSSINPSDIESMTVLKDASAGALYGARGANGVVMITTKRGKEGKANVTWRSNIGWSNRATKRYENVDQKEYVQLVYESLRNANISKMEWSEAEEYARGQLSRRLGGERYNPFKNYKWSEIIDPATGYVRSDAQSAWDEDWLDATTQDNALRHEHQLSINGGTDKTKYAISMGYLNEDGILKTTNFQRYTGRVNVDTEVTDWFSANASINVARSMSNFSDFEGTEYSNVWSTAQFINPLFPVYLKDDNGNTVYDSNGNAEFDWGEGTGRPGNLARFNSLGNLLLDSNGTNHNVGGVRAGLVFGGDSDRFGFAKGLRLAINFGADYDHADYHKFYNAKHGDAVSAGGRLYKDAANTFSYTFNQLLTWTRTFNEVHNFDVLLGHEFYEYQYDLLSGEKTGLMDGILELRPAATLAGADSYSKKYRINSLLSRINYNYDDKYYFSASLRSDASSRFKSGNRTGTFWSVGGNWRVSKEQFMQGISWIDNLSLKVSYGQQGNDDILDSNDNSDYYLWQGKANVNWANANDVGAILSSLENADISWEKNGNFNVGVEGTFFDHRLTANVEYYYRKTTDMLLNYPMAVSTGVSGYNANVGDMRNTGFEIELSGTPIRTKDWEWTLSWMGNTISNKVLKLTAESPEILNGRYLTKEGLELNTFYLAKAAGVDPETGKQQYWVYDVDENGNHVNERLSTSKTEASTSRYEMGSRIPDLYGSIGTNLRWRDLSLSILTAYSLGGKIFDGLYSSSMNVQYLDGTWNKAMERRWQKPGDVTDVPRAMLGANENYTYLDSYLFDASYFAIKNITLAYQLPRQYCKYIGLNGVRVYGSFDNVALFTHLDGMDPQYDFRGGTSYVYAPNKTLSFGVEVNF